MKTYSESQGEKPFDWHQALDNPDAYLLGELDDRAESWVTCACGNQCAAIPRNSDGKPLDKTLMFLGADFSSHVAAERWELAKRTLTQIEARSAELLAATREEGAGK